MAPGLLSDPMTSVRRSSHSVQRSKIATTIKNCLLNRSVNHTPLRVSRGVRNSYVLEDGTEIYDAAGGAAVACIGKRNKRVEKAMGKVQKSGLSYIPSLSFDTMITANLADWMIRSTDGKMRKAVLYGSGSEASEAAIKMVTQYFGKEKSPTEPDRSLFIARECSYHGATLGALNLSGFKARKALYHAILPDNMHTVPACHPYRNQQPGQTDLEYVEWHRDKLVEKIKELGSNKVAGFIVEPIVGAALGCAPAVPGYLKAMREVCDDYGILLIFDEIMCGMGRTGYLHAWQKEQVIPDIQLVGKGLAGGFAPISAMLVGHKVVEAFENGPSNGAFNHGHTFQNNPLAAAAALETQMIIQDKKLLENVREQGPLLMKRMKERLQHHRYVGDIRGPEEGLFLSLEFVKDKDTKQPFDASEGISMKLHTKGLSRSHCIWVYPGSGCADGTNGDHIILAPAYNITHYEVELIVTRVGQLVEDFFHEYDASHSIHP